MHAQRTYIQREDGYILNEYFYPTSHDELLRHVDCRMYDVDMFKTSVSWDADILISIVGFLCSP